MPAIGPFDFTDEGWEGALLMPTAKGSRPSSITTKSLPSSAVEAYAIATQYAGMVNAGGSYTVVGPDRVEILGVKVTRVTIISIKRVRIRGTSDSARNYVLECKWELCI